MTISSNNARIVCQFSCGAASAVATKLALAQYGATHDVQIVNAFLQEEHADNRRFAQDAQVWFRLRHERQTDPAERGRQG